MNNSKSSYVVSGVVALVVSVLAVSLIGVFKGQPTPTPTPTPTVAQEFTPGGVAGTNNNIVQDANGRALGDEVFVIKSLTAAPRTNQVFWRNTTGRTVYVEAEISIVSTTTTATQTTPLAASSYKFYVATSTTSSLSSDFTAPFGTLFNGWSIATSTVATTTSSKDYARTGFKVIQVLDGQYLIGQMQVVDTCSSGCQTATSTMRGFNPIFRFLMHYKP